jgi:hypothetical protein
LSIRFFDWLLKYLKQKYGESLGKFDISPDFLLHEFLGFPAADFLVLSPNSPRFPLLKPSASGLTHH